MTVKVRNKFKIYTGLIIFSVLIFSTGLFIGSKREKNNQEAETRTDPIEFSNFYRRYWTLGKLDPVRNKKWSKTKENKLELEHIPVKPRYISIRYQTDYGDTGSYRSYISDIKYDYLMDYENYVPHINKNNDIRIKPHGKKVITLFIDLGRNMPGTVEFKGNPPKDCIVRFGTGEAMEATRVYNADKKADGTWKTFKPLIKHAGYGSMRFVWIHFKHVNKPFDVKNVHGIYQVYPSTYIGEFQCSDKLLDRIWEMCAYTTHAVMAQPVGNNPKPKAELQTLGLDRTDRNPWAGDSRVIQNDVSYVFGDYDLLKKTDENLLKTGTRPIPNLQSIPPYTLDWGLALISYFNDSGDTTYLKQRFDDLIAIVKKYEGGIPKGWMFFDWDHRIDPKSKNPHIIAQRDAAFIGKYVQFCNRVAWAANILHKHNKEKWLRNIANNESKNWISKHPHWDKNYEVHVLTNMILGGVLKENDYIKAYEHVFSDRLKRCTNTPYFGIYVLQALAKMNHFNAAVQMLRDYWGTMIEAGATTTWEEWYPTDKVPVNAQPPQYGPPQTWGGLSLLQGACAGPARWLIGNIAGIRPSKPGFKRVMLFPHLTNLQWVRSAAATPEGAVRIYCRNTRKIFQLTYTVPKSIKGVDCYIPIGNQYIYDGHIVKPKKVKKQRAFFTLVSGTHTIKVRR